MAIDTTQTGKAQATGGRFQVGFASVEREYPEPVDLWVEGALPDWIEGSVVRTGPARFEVGARTVSHWFDGLALLDRFAIDGGRVTYASRMLESGAYRSASKTDEISYSEFATDPCRSLFKRFASAFSPKITDNANVNVAPDGHNWLAMTETPLQIEFDPATLETVGVRDYDDRMKAHATTAHPHHDAEGGELMSYTIAYGPVSRYQLYRRRDGSSTRERYASATSREPSYMHSFALTPRYAILTEQPLRVNPLKLLLSGRPFIENFRWQPDLGTRFLVFDRGDGRHVGTYEAEPFFVFHHVNAFERDGGLVVDLCGYDDAEIVQAFYLERLRNGQAPPIPHFRRYRIDLSGGRPAEREFELEVPFELSRIDYRRRNGRDYRFAWGTSLRGEGSGWFDQLAKIDVTSGDVRIWSAEGCHPGEPILIRRPGGEAEDDGVILSVVLDAANERSFLAVLDAATMEELARAEAPTRLPFGFHGQFARGLT